MPSSCSRSRTRPLARSLGGLGVGLTLARRIAQLHGGDVEGFSEGAGKGHASSSSGCPCIEPRRPRPPTRRRADAPGRELPRPDRRGQRRRAREPAPADGALGQRGQHRAQRRGSAREGGARSGRRSSSATSACRAWTASSWSSRLRKKLDGTPVVFAAVTGYASAEDQERALAAGFDSFLVKPLEPADPRQAAAHRRQRPPEACRRGSARSARLVERAGLADRVVVLAGVFLQPVVERLQADAEGGRGLLLVAAEVLERRQGQLPLDLGERRADADGERRRAGVAGGRRRPPRQAVVDDGVAPGVIT